MSEKTTCANTGECCKELSRVWNDLGNPIYTGKSASEHVIEIARRLQQVQAECQALRQQL